MRNYTSDARLKDRFNREQNFLLTKRIKQIKPTIKIKTSDNNLHLKTLNNNKPHKNKINICKFKNNNLFFVVQQFEIKRNNMILYKKLLDIDKNRRKKISQNLAPILNTKKKNKEIHVQNEIKTLAQENLFMLKRLLEKASNINNRKLKEDFEKNQEYKNNICNYPSINFYKNAKISEPIIESFKNKNNTNAFPTIYKMSSLQFNKRGNIFNKLDEQYYKNVKKNIKNESIIKSENNTEEKNSGNDSGSGDDDENNSGSGSGSGSGCGSGDMTESEDKKSLEKEYNNPYDIWSTYTLEFKS
jgi:hypothetical protein